METTSISKMEENSTLFTKLQNNKKFLKQQKKFKKIVKKYVESIPPLYHHPWALESLCDVDIDYLMSISTRGDGKTFGYYDFLVGIVAIDLELLSIYVSRSYIVRDAYITTFSQMFSELDRYDVEKFTVNNTRLYTECYYDNKLFGIVTDLNSVSNLKYKSSFLKRFSLIVYDEFLALEGDYLPDEFERLASLYTSMDRNNEITPYIGFPKTIFLGNPDNFSSPVLGAVNIFRHLEKHPLGTVRKYGSTVLQMEINEERNKKRNTRAYNTEKMGVTTGKFIVNNHNLVTDTQMDMFNQYKKTVIIRIEGNNYLYVYYYLDNTTGRYTYCLSMLNDFDVNYDFNVHLKDNNFNTTYLMERFYNESHYKYYMTNKYLFLDNFTKDYLLNDFKLSSIDIQKCVLFNEAKLKREERKNQTLLPSVVDDEVYRISRVKKNLFKKFYIDEYNLPY